MCGADRALHPCARIDDHDSPAQGSESFDPVAAMAEFAPDLQLPSAGTGAPGAGTDSFGSAGPATAAGSAPNSSAKPAAAAAVASSSSAASSPAKPSPAKPTQSPAKQCQAKPTASQAKPKAAAAAAAAGDDDDEDEKGDEKADAKGVGKRWNVPDTDVILEAVLEHTKHYGKPTKPGTKNEASPAWHKIAAAIEAKLTGKRSAYQIANRFFNVQKLLVVRPFSCRRVGGQTHSCLWVCDVWSQAEFKVMKKEINDDVCNHVRKHWHELAAAYGIDKDTADPKEWKEFGGKVVAEWMSFLDVTTGATPAITLNAKHVDHPTMKSALEARYVGLHPRTRSCQRV